MKVGMGDFIYQLSADQLSHQLACGRNRPVPPGEVSRDEMYRLVRSLVSTSSQAGVQLREVRGMLEPALEFYLSDDLHSSHKDNGVARAIEAFEVLQYTGCFTTSLLGSVAATASRSNHSGDASLHSDPLRSAAIEALLCHPDEGPLANGLKVDALAKVLAFFDPNLAADTFKEVCEQLLRYTKIELLRSPTVWGIFGLNPYLLSSTWDGKESAVRLSQHLAPSDVPEDPLYKLRQLQTKPWSVVVDEFCEVLDSLECRELTHRAQCVRLVEKLSTLSSESEERVLTEISLAKLLHEHGTLLISQLMTDGLYGRFHTSTQDGAYRLSGKSGALSAEQIHRISTQPFPVREIHIHGHFDGGHYGIPLSTNMRRNDLTSAQFRLELQSDFLGDNDVIDLEQREEDYATIEEASSREIEFLPSPSLESTSTEFLGYLNSPVCKNVETLNLPLSMVGAITASRFPHLKELKLWGTAKNVTAESALHLPLTLTSLTCEDANFIAALSGSTSFIEEGRIQVSKVTLHCLPHSAQVQSLIQSLKPETLSELHLHGVVNHSFLEQIQSYPQLVSLTCDWPSVTQRGNALNLAQLKKLAVRDCTSDVVKEISKSTASNLNSLSLLQTSASLSDIHCLLDTVTGSGLAEFALCGPVPWNESEFVSLLQHPSLKNLKILRLGLTPLRSVIEKLVSVGKYINLHTLDFTNPHATMMDPPLPAGLEEDLLVNTLKGSSSKLTFSFNPAQHSLCRVATQEGFGEIKIRDQIFEIYTTRELGYFGNGTTFLIQRPR